MKCQPLFLLGVFIKISLIRSISENLDSVETQTLIEGYLLCKSCGEDSSVLNLIDNSRISSLNLGLFNITIGVKQVQVQDLKNPRGIVHRCIVSEKANCAKTSGWFSESTWFEGYAWKVCLCPTCKTHIGWMFEPIELAVSNPIFPSDRGFYVIVLDSVISESYANSLLIVDKILRN